MRMPEPSTKVDPDLLTNLKSAQKAKENRPHFFALLVKGGGEGKLLVSRRKIPEKQVAEAKKAVGPGPALVKGVCFGEDGQLIFETSKPPAPSWLVTVKKQAKEAGLAALKAMFRLGRDDTQVPESAEESGEDGAPAAPPQPKAPPAAPPPPPGAAPAPAAEWQRRVAGVTDRVKAAAAARHPAARDMILGVSEAQALFRRGDTGAAGARLGQVEALLSSAPAAADPAAEYKARFAEWQGVIKQALLAKPPNAADIAKLLAQATALGKPGGDPAQALAKLKECHALATAALAAPPPAAAGPAPAADPAAEYKARFAEWQGVIKQALLAKPPNADDIAKLLAQATALGKPGGDPAQALAKLKECHALAKAVLAGGTAGKKPTADPAAEYKARFVEWQGVIKQALLAKPPNAADIAKLLAQATALGKPGGDPAQALARLKVCHALATAALAPPPPKPEGGAAGPAAPAAPAPERFSLTKLSKARLEWIAARGKAVEEIKRLQAALQAEYKDQPEEQATLAAAVQELQRVFDRLNEDLGDQLDDLLNAGEAQRLVPAKVAGATLAKFLDFIETDDLMKLLDGNEVLPDMQVTAPLRARLQAIAAALA
jgi:hypothetical protein